MPIKALPLGGLSKQLLGGIVGIGMRPIQGVVSGVVAATMMWSLHGITRVAPWAAQWMGGWIVDTFYMRFREWAPFATKYFGLLCGEEVKIEDIITARGGFTGKALYEAIGNKFLLPMMNLILPEGKITPEEGIKGAERFLGVNLTFQLQAWMLHLIGDMCSLGTFKSLKDLPNAISWSYGIGWLSWLVMGVPFRKAISDPLEEFYNRQYEPTKLNLAQTVEAYQKGLIAEKDLLDTLVGMGYSKDLSRILLKIYEKDFTAGEIRRLWEWNLIGGRDIERYFRDRGYNEERAKILTSLLKEARKIDLMEDIAKVAIKKFEDGVMTEAELRRYLMVLRYREEEIKLVVEKATLTKTEARVLTPAQIKNAVDAGLIRIDAAIKRLIGFGYSSEDAKILLAPDVKTLTVGQIRTALNKKLISHIDAHKRLTAMGYSRMDAELLLKI